MRKPLLWHSNGPEPMSCTGYGNQTALVTPRIRDAGWDVALSCMTGMSGHPAEWEGMTCLPAGLTWASKDILEPHARHWFGRDPGLVIVHYDAWAIGPEAVSGLACAGWTPVHSDPMSRGDMLFYAMSGAQPMAYSQHGARMMKAAGFSPVYIPHCVDTRTFRPLAAAERADVRSRLGVPLDAFLAVAVGANKGTDPPRKAWGEMLAGFAAFAGRHDDALLLCHTMASTPEGWGLDLRPLIADLGIGDRVLFTDDYGQVAGLFSSSYVARVTGCADVLLNPAWGEGFGLAIVQAQACGVPVIVGDNSAQSELCGAGWKVPCQRYWHHRDQAWWACPSIPAITAKLEKAYEVSRRPVQRVKLSRRARAFAEGYSVDRVFSRYWLPALAMLEQMSGAVRVRAPREGAVPLPTVEADGLRWLARGQHTDDALAFGGHEAALGPLLEALLPDGGVLVDVGAHVGLWALRLARRASSVIAVEANPDTAAALRYHVALNGLGDRVRVLQAAAWDMPARLVLTDPNRKVTGGSTRTLEPGDAAGTQVEALPLDAILEDKRRIDLVKLDVEGADLRALAGMKETLARCRPVLFIEDHSLYGYYDHDDLVKLLDALGYGAEPFTAHLAGGRQAPYVIGRPRD